MIECLICGRNLSSTKFCEYHETAYLNLKSAFNDWKSKAGITWAEYLDKVIHLEGTGQWIIEVIEYIKTEDDF
ncbi:hypothetical protein EU527_06135 [Candidatus Thorarchaeota archaeon]|nr:MAG: hypothetical protein EU527_06135 [Candidatus Thorarchaeota archaeon]